MSKKSDHLEEPHIPQGIDQSIVDACDMGLLLVDNELRLSSWNRWMHALTGIESGSALGRPLSEFFSPAENPQFLGMVQRALDQGESSRLLSLQLRYRNPETEDESGQVNLHVLAKPLSGDSPSCLVQLLDREPAGEALDQPVSAREVSQELHVRAILSSIADAVITTDVKGDIDYMNPIAEKLTGWTLNESRGMPLENVFNAIDAQSQPVIDPVHRCLKDGEVTRVLGRELVLIHRSGIGVAIEESFAPIRDKLNNVMGVVLVFRDVSHARKLAAQVSWQAAHDPLTGLLNRSSFEDKLEGLLASARDEDQEHALLYLDLDQFKIVNDTCGHVAGDELLRQVVSLIGSHVRDNDILARLGGDEFGILLANCPPDPALRIANSVRQAVKDFRFGWGEKSFSVGVSIGLVAINHQSESMEQILSAADTACYAAKDAGRNQVHQFRVDAGEAARRQGEMEWVSRIHSALDEDRFVLFAQSIIPISRKVGGGHYEVLIRMVDESGELVPPGAFIPAAERFDLMPAIDRKVVLKVFDLISKQRELLVGGGYRFAINLSGGSISDEETLYFIGEKLVEYRIPDGMISFEVTETAAISNLSSANFFIRTLKQAGCRFSLDDFGSGLSSFAYLKNLPVDYLKIDGAFVKDLAVDPIDHAMVEAINQIGHVMKLETIAEFVENEEIMQRLREIGVDYAQGFGVARPVPLADAHGNLLLNQK